MEGSSTGREQGGVKNPPDTGGGKLEFGQIGGQEFGGGSVGAGRAGEDAGEDAADFSQDRDRDGDHGVGADLELGVEEGAVVRIVGNRILADRLPGGVDEADDAAIEGLLEGADEVLSVGSGAEGGGEVVFGGQPEGGIFGPGSFGGAAENLAQKAESGIVDPAGEDPVSRDGAGGRHCGEELTPP